jgi:hypothetical protein
MAYLSGQDDGDDNDVKDDFIDLNGQKSGILKAFVVSKHRVLTCRTRFMAYGKT